VPVDYLLGLDLGRNRDHSTLAIVERAGKPANAGMPETLYAVRHLRRWPLKTSYTIVMEGVAEVVRRPPLCQPVLVVDQTGVGQAIVDCLIGAELAATVVPVMITSGRGRSRTDGKQWFVPKSELVFCLRGLLRSKRLQIAALPERLALAHELMSFQVTVTKAANETFAARSERDHDDLLLAVALATWWGERGSFRRRDSEEVKRV
jgi:hypothetical protein